MNEITGILVDVFNKRIEAITLKYEDYNDYSEQLQNLLQCEWFDHKQISLNGIGAYCKFNDIGKLITDKPIIPGLLLVNEKSLKVCDYIVGNIWIEKFDGGEDTTSFTPEDLFNILNSCIFEVDYKNNLTGFSDTTKVLISVANWVSISDREGLNND